MSVNAESRDQNTFRESFLRQSRSRSFSSALLFALAFAAIGLSRGPIAGAQVNVTTQHNDIGRTGQNLSETILNTSNVNTAQFGKLFSQAVDGTIYAQPLYLSNIAINGVTHNVVFVATMHGSVYAFDADSNNGANMNPLWKASMLSTAHGEPAGAAIIAGIAITATPVIDPVSNTLYLVSGTVEATQQFYRLHALDVTTGAEKFGGPVLITGGVTGTAPDNLGGTVIFYPSIQNQRPGLLLLNGIVYIGFASRDDVSPWHGWVLGYDAHTLVQTGVFCTTPNGNGAGLWNSGAGLAADQLDPVGHPYGRMFVATGNGDYTATVPYGSNMDFGDSVVNLDLTNGMPKVTDEFTPNVQAALNAHDTDQGSGGVMILPTQTAGVHPDLLVQAGKSGTLFLLDRDNLGGYNASADQVVQAMPKSVGNPGIFSSPAYWNGNVYYWGQYDYLKSFALVNGLLTQSSTTSNELYTYPGASPSISANGSTEGIVWTLDPSAFQSAGPAILRAHDANNVATTLYSSATNPARDSAGPAVRFAVPTIANGKVYVGATNELDFYGLFNASTHTGTPSISPGSESFVGSVSVTITDATPNAAIYYTTNGAPASTASTLYNGPISVTSSQTINAIASVPGLEPSYQVSARYTRPGTAMPAFSLAAVAYTGAQTVTISDATSGATIYYTTDGTTPTHASSVYSGPITVGATETLQAIAVAPGYLTSAALGATYTIASSSALAINYPAGFASTAGMNLVGTTTLSNNALQLSSAANTAQQQNAAWYTAPVGVQKFTTDFYFQETSAVADGFTFTIHNAPAGASALGRGSSGLGYQGIGSSVAVKFDLFDNAGEGVNSTGFYTNGVLPTMPAVDMTASGVYLRGGHILDAHLTYDGTTLTLKLTDTVTGASFTTSTPINIPATVGANTAYVGFTAGTTAASSARATQTILNWTYVTDYAPPAATPTFTPGAGTYAGVQAVTISDATSGATIYYTTNGTTPTASSSVYSAPISVSTSQTLRAIAVASGYSSSAVGSAVYTIAPAATPIFTPGAGTYKSAQTVTISDATSGATIYYAADGTTPTASSSVYSAPISVSASQTLRAIAVANGYSSSAVGSAVYTIAPPAATPTFTPGAGAYAGVQTVTISDATSGARIYYSTDGTTPTTSSSVYSAPIGVSGQTLRAIAVASGYSNSAVGLAIYTIAPAATPTFTPKGGIYTVAQTVTISDATSGATIYYTADGTTPTTSSLVYSAPIGVNANQTLRAMAVASGYSNSVARSAVYTIAPLAATPTFSPGAGTYAGVQTVTISDATSGATMYYSTDGTTPTTSSSVYSAPISVSGQTLRAIAVASGYSNSAVGLAIYKIAPAATPIFTPVAGTYKSAQTVTISDATSGATIYYTADGTTPTTSSSVYSSPISVSASQTLRAIAVANGYSNSVVGSAVYTIAPAATPIFTPGAGTYTGVQTVTISDSTSGATIYYSTDGTAPTTSSSVYSAPISVSASLTLRAIAVASGYSSSATRSAVYTIVP